MKHKTMNDERIAAMLKGLQTAMRAEHEGYHFYLLAAQNTDDEQGKEAFQQLANDEFDHLNYLQAQIDNIEKTHQPDAALRLKKVAPFTASNPIFSEKIKDRIKNAHHEMTVLSVGAQLELNAMLAYKKWAAEAQDKIVERFYLELAEWESAHYQRLIGQQDALKEEYWTTNHFQPF